MLRTDTLKNSVQLPTRISIGLAAGMSGISSAVVLGQFDFGVVNYPSPDRATAAASLDFDGDGHLDIAVGSGAFVDILRNRGDGLLEFNRSLPVSLYAASDLARIRLGSDIFDDIVACEVGTFISSSYLHTYSNVDGLGGVDEAIYGLPSSASDLSVADFDGDGQQDVAVLLAGGIGSVTAQIHVYANSNGTLSRSAVAELPYEAGNDVIAGDFDDDGDIDLASLSFSASYSSYYGYKVRASELVILSNDGTGQFEVTQRADLPFVYGEDDAPQTVCAGDLDGDGDLDLAAVIGPLGWERLNQIVLFENLPEGFAIRKTLNGARADPRALVSLADCNSDGRLDLVYTAGGASGFYLFQNNGAWTFDNAQRFGPSYGAYTTELFAAPMQPNGVIDLISTDDWGVNLFRNFGEYANPTLTISDLARGQPATMRIDGARPGELVTILYSLDGYGPSRGIPALGGLCLDLAGNVAILDIIRADATGTALWSGLVPARAPVRTVYVQAVIRRGQAGARSLKTMLAFDPID